MGAYLSPEDKLMRPKPDNPKGFWEREDVYKLNERILNSGGGSWFNLVDFAWDRIDADQRAAHTREIRHILAGMDAHRPWALKDPRLCVTFPLWREQLEVPICVHIHRSPLEIARSLSERNGFPLSMGVGLWELYSLHAIRASGGLPTILVRYEDIMTDPAETVRLLFKELRRLGARGLRLPSQTEITAFVAPQLRHHRHESTEEGRFLTQSQRGLANAIAHDGDLANIEFAPSPAGLESQRSYLEAQAYQSRLSELEKTLSDAQAHQKSLTHQLKEHQNQSEQRIAQLVQERQRTEECFSMLQQRHQTLEQQRHEQSVRIGKLESQIRRVAADIQATRESWRWRIGDRVVRTAEIALRRPRVRLAMDNIQDALQSALAEQGRSFQPTTDDRIAASDLEDRILINDAGLIRSLRVIQFTPPKPRNPFFFMVGDALSGMGVDYHYNTDRDAVLRLVRNSDKDSIVHFHHLEPLYHPGLKHEGAVRQRAQDLLGFLKSLKIAGAKLVWTKHNAAPHDRTYLAIDEALEAEALTLMDRVIVLAQGARTHLAKSINAERIAVIPHPSYRSYYGRSIPRDEARARLELPSDAFIIGNIGEIKPYKGLERIIEAYSHFRTTQEGQSALLLLAGNAGPKDYVEALEQALPEGARLIARDIPETELPLWLGALDAAVFAFEDIWVSGSVILALSYERPALVPDIGFLDEYVDHENTGLFYRHGDSEDLARAMVAMASIPYRTHFQYMCRVFEKKHALPSIADLYLELYTGIRHQPNQPAGQKRLAI